MSSGTNEKECARDISARGLGSEQSPDPCRSVQRAGLTSGPASWAHQRCRPKVATCPSSRATPSRPEGGERRRSHGRARHPIRVPAPLAPPAGSPPAALRSLTARWPRLPPLPSYRELNATTYTLHLHLHLHLNLHTVVGVPPLSRVPARLLVPSKPQTSSCFW